MGGVFGKVGEGAYRGIAEQANAADLLTTHAHWRSWDEIKGKAT
jgi:hypothetical protein